MTERRYTDLDCMSSSCYPLQQQVIVLTFSKLHQHAEDKGVPKIPKHEHLQVHIQACISHHVLLLSFENCPVFLLWYLSNTVIHFLCSVFNFNYCHCNYPTTFSSTHLLQTSYLHDFSLLYLLSVPIF